MRPIILCFSGHDPTGGAGIQADIETIAAHGAQAMTVVTALTTQNAHGVSGFTINPQLVQQTETLLQDYQVDAVKIGMVACQDHIHTIAQILQTLANIPVVLDPVLHAGAQGTLSDDKLDFSRLLQAVTLATPNQQELHALTNNGTANDLLAQGCQHVLLTTTDSSDAKTITHQWHSRHGQKNFDYPRLPGSYHGSGCTLASSIAAQLACKTPIAKAIPAALDFSWHSLKHATKTHLPQALPWRFFKEP